MLAKSESPILGVKREVILIKVRFWRYCILVRELVVTRLSQNDKFERESCV